MTAMLSPEPLEGIRATLSYRGREVSCEIPRVVMEEFFHRELAAGRDWSAVRAVLRRLDTDEDWPCHIFCPASETHPE